MNTTTHERCNGNNGRKRSTSFFTPGLSLIALGLKQSDIVLFISLLDSQYYQFLITVIRNDIHRKMNNVLIKICSESTAPYIPG